MNGFSILSIVYPHQSNINTVIYRTKHEILTISATILIAVSGLFDHTVELMIIIILYIHLRSICLVAAASCSFWYIFIERTLFLRIFSLFCTKSCRAINSFFSNFETISFCNSINAFCHKSSWNEFISVCL